MVKNLRNEQVRARFVFWYTKLQGGLPEWHRTAQDEPGGRIYR